MAHTNDNYSTFFSTLTLNDIRLLKSMAERDDSFSPPAKIVTTHETSVSTKGERNYVVRCSLDVKGTADGAEQPGLALTSNYDVTYSADGELDERATSLLANNALLACWPFFRLFVRSTTSEMGFAPLTLSLLKATFEPPAPAEPAKARGRKKSPSKK